MTTATAGSARTYLREVTAPLHASVDEAFGQYQLALPAHYGAFLQAHAAALVPLEAGLHAAGVAQWLPDWPARVRGQALLADLHAMGLDTPAPLDWAGESDPAAWWGVAYVLEGSRLGARFIARQVGEGMPTAYLRHGEGQPWFASFVKALEAAPLAPGSHAALERGATAAFQMFLSAARRHAPTGV